MANQELPHDTSAQERGVFWTPHSVGEDLKDAYIGQDIAVHKETADLDLIEHGARIGSEILLKSLLEHDVQIPGELLESETFKATITQNAQNAAAETKRAISTPTTAS